jgi:tripartite-type tricarboxylate transporter receptor subunit TctC
MLFASLPSAIGYIKSGKLRPLAVSGTARAPVLPDVPTIAETIPGYSGTLWIGLFAPAGVPQVVLDRLEAGMAKTLASRDLRDKLELQGVEMAAPPDKPVTPAQFAKTLNDDIAKWARIVKSSGATLD